MIIIVLCLENVFYPRRMLSVSFKKYVGFWFVYETFFIIVSSLQGKLLGMEFAKFWTATFLSLIFHSKSQMLVFFFPAFTIVSCFLIHEVLERIAEERATVISSVICLCCAYRLFTLKSDGFSPVSYARCFKMSCGSFLTYSKLHIQLKLNWSSEITAALLSEIKPRKLLC